MKGIIILAVTIFLVHVLVHVQASCISTIQKEHEDLKKAELLSTLQEEETDVGNEVKSDAAADNSETFGGLYEIQKMETIDHVLHFIQNCKEVMGCSSNTCEWCLMLVCVQITFKAETSEFQFCAKYKDDNVFCKTVPAKDFVYCTKIQIQLVTLNVCLEIKNVNISEGKACMDAKISAVGMSKSFKNICMGISNP